MLLMIAQHLDEALGLSNLTNMINLYLPAEHVASSLVTLKQQLPATFTQPTPTAVLVWATAAIMLLAVLEQVKYQIGRFGKGGKQLPGGRQQEHAETAALRQASKRRCWPEYVVLGSTSACGSRQQSTMLQPATLRPCWYGPAASASSVTNQPAGCPLTLAHSF
jgi:hypothetical protein